MEISGLQGIIDGTPVTSGINTFTMITPNNPNDVILTAQTDYNFAASGDRVWGMLAYPPYLTFVSEPGNGIGAYALAPLAVVFY